MNNEEDPGSGEARPRLLAAARVIVDLTGAVDSPDETNEWREFVQAVNDAEGRPAEASLFTPELIAAIASDDDEPRRPEASCWPELPDAGHCMYCKGPFTDGDRYVEHLRKDHGVEVAGATRRERATTEAESEGSSERTVGPTTNPVKGPDASWNLAARPTEGRENGGPGNPCDGGSSPPPRFQPPSTPNASVVRVEAQASWLVGEKMLPDEPDVLRPRVPQPGDTDYASHYGVPGLRSPSGPTPSKTSGSGEGPARDGNAAIDQPSEPDTTIEPAGGPEGAGTTSAHSSSSAPGPWRVGRKLGRIVYCGEKFVALFDEPDMAASVVSKMNDHWNGTEPRS